MSIDKLKKIIKINEEEENSSDEIRIRQLISEEYTAIKNYQQFADETEDPEIRKVLLDIKNEEIVHAGELEALLIRKGIDDKVFIRKGAREVKKLLKNGEKETGETEESNMPVVKPMPIVGEAPYA